MDDKKIAALAKKNAAKAAKSSGKKGFGKKYDKNLSDLPTDEATLKERQEHEREMTDERCHRARWCACRMALTRGHNFDFRR